MSERQRVAIKAWWDARKAAGWAAPKMSREERLRLDRERQARKRQANPMPSREAARSHYHANKDAITAKRKTNAARTRQRETERNLRMVNGDAVRAHERAEYVRCRESKLARNTRWRMRNPERVRANARKRDALKSGTSVGPVDYGRVLRESDGRCGICHAEVNLANPKAYHYDHIIPLARGGGHVQENIQLSHATCNMQKGWSLQ